MLNAFVPLVRKLRGRFPRLYSLAVGLAKRWFGGRFGVYPRVLGGEIEAVTSVLRGSQWNMAYGHGLAHERLEAAFAEYVGVPHAIAVGSGGMAIQLCLRALGIRPGDEVIHQVDTCSATAMAVMNAGATPVFSDISEDTFMLSLDSVRSWQGPRTKALIATHMWGNPENMAPLREIARSRDIRLIEDACLALGAVVGERAAGSLGDVGVFSFGCLKPIQGGEGGMIVTADADLARELRSLRHWGDRTIDFGVRDVTQLSWNGRMSEIVAAVVLEQLRGYPAHLAALRETVAQFSEFIGRLGGIRLVSGTASNIRQPAFTQVVVALDESISGKSKQAVWSALTERGVPVWHANFELINSLSLFSKGTWRNWILCGDVGRIESNYASSFPCAQRVFAQSGLGLGKTNFMSTGNLRHLMKSLASAMAGTRA